MDAVNKSSLLPTTTNEELERLAVMIGVDFDEMVSRGMSLVDWTCSQPHLPIARENFYASCGFAGRVLARKKMSAERTKQFIDDYYTLKSLAPEYLLDRDPANPQLRASLEVYRLAPMPALTERLTRVYAITVIDRDFSPHMMTDWNKFAMMVVDVQLWNEMCYGEEVVIDLRNITLQHVAVLTPSVIKKMVVCYLKAFTMKPCSFHLVNAPSYTDSVLSVLKPLLKPKIANRIFVHSKEGYQSLHEHISPKYLPKDFGGDGPAMKDVHDAMLEKVDSYREWLLEHDNYLVQENLRSGKPVFHSDIFGMEGSFRQLVVD